MSEEPDKLVETREIQRDEKGRILPGQPSLNPKGRGAGQTLKEFQAQRFRDMTEEEKEAFLEEIGADIKWKMAEGNPASSTEVTGKDGGPIEIQGVEISIRK